MKDKQWKDYWDVDLGCSYIPIDKLDPQVCSIDDQISMLDFFLVKIIDRQKPFHLYQ